jgi:GT2 family glycosyltransferase
VCAAFVRGLIDLWSSPVRAALDGVIQIQSGPTIAHARDELTRIFLTKNGAPILVMVDTDMDWRAAHVGALLALADKAGVVGARYSGHMPGTARKVPEAGHFVNGTFVPIVLGDTPDELVDVDVIGAGLLVIRREVFLDIAKLPPGEPLPWWSQSIRDGGIVEEDFEFCLRAKEAGRRVALAARVTCPHMKMVGIL